MAVTFSIPGPLSEIRMWRLSVDRKFDASAAFAYRKALRAISDTAVAIRVCSCESNPSRAGNTARALTGGYNVLLGANPKIE